MTRKQLARTGRKNLSGFAAGLATVVVKNASAKPAAAVKMAIGDDNTGDLAQVKKPLTSKTKPKATTVINGRPHALNKPMASISDVGAATVAMTNVMTNNLGRVKNKVMASTKPLAASGAGSILVTNGKITDRPQGCSKMKSVTHRATVCVEKPAAASHAVKKAPARTQVVAAIKAVYHAQAAHAA